MRTLRSRLPGDAEGSGGLDAADRASRKKRAAGHPAERHTLELLTGDIEVQRRAILAVWIGAADFVFGIADLGFACPVLGMAAPPDEFKGAGAVPPQDIRIIMESPRACRLGGEFAIVPLAQQGRSFGFFRSIDAADFAAPSHPLSVFPCRLIQSGYCCRSQC